MVFHKLASESLRPGSDIVQVLHFPILGYGARYY